ncbi:hypothetical protein ES703_124572 [subsurface metagenome]
MTTNNRHFLSKILRQRRLMTPLTLEGLGRAVGVSPSYLSRIEQGKRFPSARILHRIAKPLGFKERELLALAGYLSSQSPTVVESEALHDLEKLDPYVARVLALESVAIQLTVIGILAILKSIAKRDGFSSLWNKAQKKVN